MAELRRVTSLRLRLSEEPWAFADGQQQEIASYFAKAREANPTLWNGRILLCRRPDVRGDVFCADFFEADFASFLAWRDWGFPDKAVFNCSGGGALRSADGAFVLGRMSAHTVNAGLVCFPAGMPDASDLRNGEVDLAASVTRELEEEIGLKSSDYETLAGWTIVTSGQICACLRSLRSPLAAEPLKLRIEEFLRRETAPELCEVKLVRSPADFEPAMPSIVTTFLRHALVLRDGEGD